MFMFFSLTFFVPVKADVPTVIEIEWETRGQDTVVIVTVRHSSPTSRHYVDAVDIEIDGEIENIEDLEAQTETTFTVELTLNSAFTEIRARARCTTHGLSRWVSETVEEEPSPRSGIPGFPYVSVVIGLLIVYFTARKRTITF